MPVTSIVICIAGESPVRSMTPLIGTDWPERSMVIEKRAVVILVFAALSRARKSALSTVVGALGSEVPTVGLLLVGPACGSVAEAWLELLPHAANEDRASGRAATRAALRRVRVRMGSSRAVRVDVRPVRTKVPQDRAPRGAVSLTGDPCSPVGNA